MPTQTSDLPSPVFQNEHFVLLDKPAGWLSIPSRIGDKDSRPCLNKSLSERYKKQVFVVHRLDAEVSGLILFALSADAHRSANLWFEKRTIQKTYEALTSGPTLNSGYQEIFEDVMIKGKKRAYSSPIGKKAVTHAMIHGSASFANEKFNHWQLIPRTGRSHQLRFQLSRRGYPIVGDQLYGSPYTYKEQSIALRSVSLDFSGCMDAAQFGLPSSILLNGFSDQDQP